MIGFLFRAPFAPGPHVEIAPFGVLWRSPFEPDPGAEIVR